MTEVYVNRIATAVPEHEGHAAFLRFARSRLQTHPARARLFDRMAERGGIERRHCCYAPADGGGASVDADGLFRRGAFPGTAARMRLYERHAPGLAARAVAALGVEGADVTHLVVTSCTGFFSPGIDLEIMRRCGLNPGVERTIIGFMGCHAAVNALRLARHAVRSEPGARVLVVNLELCTLHLKETEEIEELLTYYLWGDGCAAALVTAEPAGFRLDGFHSALAGGTGDLMQWAIRDQGFDMTLSGQVPTAISRLLAEEGEAILGGRATSDIAMWAVHPGGRSVLDEVERSLGLGKASLAASREVLRRFGNMSSATVMFVLKTLLDTGGDGHGCGMAFGPGLVVESFTFSRAAA